MELFALDRGRSMCAQIVRLHVPTTYRELHITHAEQDMRLNMLLMVLRAYSVAPVRVVSAMVNNNNITVAILVNKSVCDACRLLDSHTVI